ncbi:MAG: methyltransferase type 12 [Rickettsiales bacterium]|nr:methyltransferase type 12 [Rickettsiales bacterium]
MKCIVCHNYSAKVFVVLKEKKYWKCNFCNAKFLDKKNFLDSKLEKQHYLKHENDLNHLGYRKFLSKLSNPLVKKISNNDVGLDFGCGHVPVLADILSISGFKLELYDPFFYPNKKNLKRKYDFITCSEVAEHFFNPFYEFNLLNKLLKPKGIIALMTCFMTSDDLFENWYYRRDPTHVVFYNEKTFKIIASQRDWKFEIYSKDIVFLFKS